MKKVKSFMGMAAFLFAIVAAFAFNRPSVNNEAADAKSPNALVWLKYNCSNPGVPQIVPTAQGGNIRASFDNPLFSNCTGETETVCARLYDENDLVQIPGQPAGNFQPRAGATILAEEYCQF